VIGVARRELNNGPVIQDEKETVSKMIHIYCRKKHHHPDELCEDCQQLETYCLQRLSLCRFGEKKGACSNCSIHCYKKEFREKIKKVMRFSGKWMVLYHPVYSIKHLVKQRQE
jgi:hypothetical protein